jgi:hypothetical protein
MRTVKMWGRGFGSTPAEITVTLDGATIYSGTITTDDTPPWALPNPVYLNQEAELCSFELPMDFSGQKSMTCTVTNGIVIFGTITANYCQLENLSIPGTYVSSGPDMFLALSGVGALALTDVRSEVTIDTIEQSYHPPGSTLTGTWGWTVNPGSVLAYNLNAIAGVDVLLGHH